MADRKAMGILGAVFGSLTFAVMLTAVVVVKAHMNGYLQLEASAGAPVSAIVGR
jgi:hypothetical protein